MCETVKVEMRCKLEGKTMTFRSGFSNKRRIHKPWWTVQLSELCNSVYDMGNIWHEANGRIITHQDIQKRFD